MKKIRILQIGDIHFPSVKETTASASFGSDPDEISNVSENLELPAVVLNKISAAMLSVCDPEPDLIVFVGDYTTGADKKGLKDAIDFCFKGIITKFFKNSDILERVLFVPGNHDVKRPKKNTEDPIKKIFQLYKCFRKLWYSSTLCRIIRQR